MESDRPIQKPSEDRFGRWPFAQRVGQVIANRADSSSIVVGVHAPWGDGKTSVLNMIVEELKNHQHILVVHFNPWRFPDETQLLSGFFKSLAGAVDASLETRGEKLGDIARKYAGLLAPVSLLGVNAKDAVKGAAEISPVATLEQLKERIEAVLSESGKRIVVVMDDIDRLDKEEVQATFRLVKLSADFPNTAYVLAFDEQRVAEALDEKYFGKGAGRNFLEKIIQVPLPLPPVSIKARRAMAIEGIQSALKLAQIELTEDQRQRFINVFDKAFLHRIETPRLAKRFANALTFALPLLRGEVDTVDLILLEALRTFYPKLYTEIRENEDVFVGSVFDLAFSPTPKKEAEERVQTVLNASLEGLSKEDIKAARCVIQELFPKTGASGMFPPGSYGADDIGAREKRIASKYYFQRYFTYGVPPHDVSDKELEEFIQGIPDNDIEFVQTKLKELAANDRADVLIEKLRSFEDELSPDVAKRLADGVARSGGILPKSHPTDKFFGLGAYAQASSMIRHLVDRISDLNERENFALELADLTEPLPLAFEYSRWMRPLKRSHHSEEKVATVSSECEAEIYKRIAKRIAAEAHQEPLERKYPLDAQLLYQFWVNNDEEAIRIYLETRFAENPQEADEFLIAVLGVHAETKSRNGLEIMDGRGWYELIARMIEPDKLIRALKYKYPEIDSPHYLTEHTENSDGMERAAKWFAIMWMEITSHAASAREFAEGIEDLSQSEPPKED
jgi:predicted KAP-like P-loop ATPase